MHTDPSVRMQQLFRITPFQDSPVVLAEDATGRIWMGSRLGRGLGYFHEGKTHLYAPGEKAPMWIGAMVADGKGGLWLGSTQPVDWDGLGRWNGKRFRHVSGISGCAILALCRSPEGLWIGTNEGLYRRKSGTTRKVLGRGDLPCSIITALLYAHGKLWVGTEGGGVVVYDGKVHQRIQASGDPDGEVIHQIFQDQEGQLWFATEGGLIHYTPKHQPPTVQITGVQVGDRPFAGERPVTPDRVRFSIQGESPVESTHHLVYWYRLHGHDPAWQQKPERAIEYPPLPPGEYAFAVQAVDRDLNYSEPAQAAFRVVSPAIKAGPSKKEIGRPDERSRRAVGRCPVPLPTG